MDASAAIAAVIGDVDRLPSVPSVYLELKRQLENPRADAGDVAAIVERDPAMAAKLMQLARSAAFAGAHQAADVPAAVARLGFSTVHAVATAAAVFASTAGRRLPPGLDVNALQSRALRAGTMARRLAPGNSDAFMAALLADVGWLALAVANLDAFDRVAHAGGHDIEAERGALGTDHAAIGAWLLQRWELPERVVTAVAWHHDLARAPRVHASACAAVHVACMSAEGLKPSRPALTLAVGQLDADALIARSAAAPA